MSLNLQTTVVQHDVIVQLFNVAEVTLTTLYNNTPAVFWNRKGSTTMTGPAAYLLRLQSLHAKHYRYVPTHDFIPGVLNKMVDDASRLLALSDAKFLAHFDLTFPQCEPWRLCQPRSEMNSAVTCLLRSKRSEPELWINELVSLITIGHAGWNSVNPSLRILGSHKGRTQSPTYRSTQPDIAMDASHPAGGPFDLAQFRMPYVPWVRRTGAWGPEIPNSTSTEPWTSD